MFLELIIITVSLTVTFFLLKILLINANKLNLVDNPSSLHKAHLSPIPVIGGVAIFIAFIICVIFFNYYGS